MNIRKYIFSKNLSENQKNVIIRLFGIKIFSYKNQNKILKDIGILDEKINYLTELLTNSLDISSIPPAQGTLLLMQQASTCIFRLLVKILEKHQISWWLSYGTLLGKVRHNGFIPWDDDIDICVPRADYEKLIPILEKEFVKDGFFILRGEATRLMYKKTPAQVDIFPMDQGWQKEPLQGEELDAFVAKLKEIHQSLDVNWVRFLTEQKPNLTMKEIEKAFKSRDSILMKGPVLKDGFLYRGIESLCSNESQFSYSDVFPLKECMFYDIKAYMPRNTDYYLYCLYGEYMTFPKKDFHAHADIRGRLDKESFEACQYLVEKYGKIS